MYWCSGKPTVWWKNNFQNNIAMKSIFICLLFFVVSAKAQSLADTTVVRNISREKFTWMIDKDTAKLKMLLHQNVQYTHSNGWIETMHEVLNDIVTGKLTYTSVTVESDTVRLFQKTGIVTGRGVFKVLMEGKEVAIKLLYTEVYVKYKKNWKLVQRNATKI